MLLKQKTKKLFHGRYPYKITCKIIGISALRTAITNKNNLKISIEEMISLTNANYFNNYRSPSNKIDPMKLYHFILCAEDILKDKNIRSRIENNNIDFYVEDYQKFVDLQSKLQKFITVVTAPNNEQDLALLLGNKKVSICNAYPYQKYQYRITFKHMPEHSRFNFIKWLEKYENNQIYIPESVNLYLRGLQKYCSSIYCYVEDSKTLILVSMALSGYIQRTEEYVLRSSINNQSNQENLCPV